MIRKVLKKLKISLTNINYGYTTCNEGEDSIFLPRGGSRLGEFNIYKMGLGNFRGLVNFEDSYSSEASERGPRKIIHIFYGFFKEY